VREVQPHVWYTKDEMRKLLTSERSAYLAARGFDTLQVNPMTGECRVTKGTDGTVTSTGTFDPVPTIQKRTPQQRVDSLQEKINPDMTQGAPGIPEEEVTRLVGETWKLGQPLSSEQVRRAAAVLLQEAENRHEAKLAKQVTRHEE